MQAGGQEFDPPHLHQRDKVKERTEKPKQELLKVVENGEVDGSACGIEVIDLEVKLDILKMPKGIFKMGA